MHDIDTTRYLDQLDPYAMVLTRNPAEAEDLVQETYVRALKSMGSLREDSNVRSWLFTILRNIWLNQLRRRRAGPEIAEMDSNENVANLAVDTRQDPHALYVSKVSVSRCGKRSSSFPWNFARLSCCVSTKGFPIRRSQPFCNARWEQSCRAWQELAPGSATCFLPY